MPVQTVYKCDQCAAESLKGQNYIEVELRSRRRGVHWPDVIRSRLLCQTCADSFSLPTPMHSGTKDDPQPDPKFEDLVRAIVGEELDARGLG